MQGYTGPDGSACTGCLPGTFKVTNGSAACTDCLTGKYSNVTAATTLHTCNVCPSNHSNSSVVRSGNISDCKCESGYTGPDGGGCTACPVGTIKALQGPGPCADCPAGTYSNGTAASTCNFCIVNTFSNTTKASKCTPCSNFSYDLNDKYYSLGAAWNCSKCPLATEQGQDVPQGCPSFNDNRLAAAMTVGD